MKTWFKKFQNIFCHFRAYINIFMISNFWLAIYFSTDDIKMKWKAIDKQYIWLLVTCIAKLGRTCPLKVERNGCDSNGKRSATGRMHQFTSSLSSYNMYKKMVSRSFFEVLYFPRCQLQIINAVQILYYISPTIHYYK